MKKAKSFNIAKYIQKLSAIKAPHYVIASEQSLGLRPYRHPDGNFYT